MQETVIQDQPHPREHCSQQLEKSHALIQCSLLRWAATKPFFLRG